MDNDDESLKLLLATYGVAVLIILALWVIGYGLSHWLPWWYG